MPDTTPADAALRLTCVLARGSGMPEGAAITALAEFDGKLVAGTTGPGGLWRRDEGGWVAISEASLAGGDAVTGLLSARTGKEKRPSLHVAVAMSQGGVRLLRSQDGTRFSTVLDDPSAGAARIIGPVAHQKKLVLSVAGTPQALPARTVLASADPEAGNWEAISPAGFDDSENEGISALASDGHLLYAATLNHKIGFQLWCRSDDGTWTRLLNEGATRFAMNPGVSTMLARNGALWLGTELAAKPAIPGLEWPAAELIQLHADGSWDLIAGEARFTPDGLRFPLSLYGPGFDDPAATRIGAIIDLQGTILTGTAPAVWLWASRDGMDWSETDLSAASDLRPGGGVTAALTDESGAWIAIDGALWRAENR